MKRNKCAWIGNLLLIIGILSLINIPFADNVNWSGVKDVGDWNNTTSYASGWSEWSTTVPTGVYAYVRTKVYVSVDYWNGQYSTGSSQSTWNTCDGNSNVNCMVRKHNGTDTTYYGRTEYSYSYCNGNYGGDEGSIHGGCDWKWGSATGWCVKPGYAGSCSGASYPCGQKAGYTQACYWYRNEQKSEGTESYCNGDSSGSDRGCGVKSRTYYYQEATHWKDVSNKSNWKTSVSAAGGYAKWVYVYSYPKKVYINYDGNGANQICNNWATGSNDVNSNTSIKYELGNPVCSSAFVTGMMSQSEIDWDTGGNLTTNKYYRVGYDFKGWSLNPNGTGTRYTDSQHVTHALLGSLKPGETIKLYAVWEKHTYTITYDVICGTATTTSGGTSSNGNSATYQYGNIVSLPTDVVCTGTDVNTKFLGWYTSITTNGTYTGKMTTIPNTYYTDITLYARQRQKRYYNYESSNWEDAGK